VPIIVSGRGDMPVDNTSGCGGILNTDKCVMKLLEMLFGRDQIVVLAFVACGILLTGGWCT